MNFQYRKVRKAYQEQPHSENKATHTAMKIEDKRALVFHKAI